MAQTFPSDGTRMLSAAVVNAMIRALMRRTYGRPLYADEAEEYGQLLEEWAAATRAEMGKAA